MFVFFIFIKIWMNSIMTVSLPMPLRKTFIYTFHLL